MPRKKTVTLRHLADRLGLTVHTVSKALRGLPGMAESTRREVLLAARELGYVTKAQEDGMSAERIYPIDGKRRRFVLFVGAHMSYFATRFNGLQVRMQELGHNISTAVVPKHLKNEKELLEWMEQEGHVYADGLFLTPGIPEWIEALIIQMPLSKVLISYPPDSAEVDSVVWDVQHAVHLAVDKLHADGHERILYVGNIESQRGFRLRWLSFSAALVRNGMDMAKTGLLDSGTGDREAWLKQLETAIISGNYTAILSVLPEETEWIIGLAQKLGINLPNELSLIGMEHDEHERYPQLTRPILRVQEAGERAAELMLRRVANPHLPCEHIRLLGPMIQGNTAGVLNIAVKETQAQGLNP